ncbi:MAG: hypothetical protein WC292_00180 [Clostridia bacterium]
MNMYKTLEENAKRAKEAYSFRDYESGSATAEYKSYCAQAQEAADRAIAQLKKASAPEERIERVNYLLEKYKVKKLDWLNNLYLNRASVPSVMIAGGSNYPTRKKEKQIAREKTIYENNPDYIIEQIKSMGREAKVKEDLEKVIVILKGYKDV